jgi:hypothetical protein
VLNRRGDRAEFGGSGWILCGQLIKLADFDICRHHTGPLSARAQEPTAMADQPRRDVKFSS